MMVIHKRAFVLLSTMAIAMGVMLLIMSSIKSIKKSNNTQDKNRAIIQSKLIAKDVIAILKKIDIEDRKSLKRLIDSSNILSYSYNDTQIQATISSARGRVSIGRLVQDSEFRELFVSYLDSYSIANGKFFVDLLLDVMSDTDSSYRTDIFDRLPTLYRGKIVDKAHLDKIVSYYKSIYSDDIDKMRLDEVFRYSDSDMIDINYISTRLWSIYLPRYSKSDIASVASSSYDNLDDIEINQSDIQRLKSLDMSTYMPIVSIDIYVAISDSLARCKFEYDFRAKKGMYFEYF
jgi:hypothetical protein